ncbi:MAG: AzlC family ABC transporter permease, partial [Pseudomonadota bacterium]
MPATAMDGVRQCLPIAPPVFIFAVAFGALASTIGLTGLEAFLMSTLVFAGASQVAALGIWSDPLPVLALISVVAAVNARFFLMGATISPLLHGLPLWKRAVMLHFTVDPNWALSM